MSDESDTTTVFTVECQCRQTGDWKMLNTTGAGPGGDMTYVNVFADEASARLSASRFLEDYPGEQVRIMEARVVHKS